jgi:hypothetical protein
MAHPSGGRAVVAGVAIGLALSCKFTCALVVPALLMLMILRRPRSWLRISDMAIVAVAAFFTLWATYFFDFDVMPMPSFFAGLTELWRHNALGHVAYLNGQINNSGWWYYFPEALLLKSPLALLIGLVLAIPFAFRRGHGILVLLVPFVVFMVIPMYSGINIGVRHVLPAIPLLYLFVVLTLGRTKLAFAPVLLLIATFIRILLMHPDYLAFFNSLGGGPDQGERFLLDSNLDWGQDQARAARWLQENARGRAVTLRVFGNPRLYQWPHEGYEIVPPGAPPQGLLVISKNVLHGLYPSYFTDSSGRGGTESPVLPPAGATPVARIGLSILVYDLDKP